MGLHYEVPILVLSGYPFSNGLLNIHLFGIPDREDRGPEDEQEPEDEGEYHPADSKDHREVVEDILHHNSEKLPEEISEWQSKYCRYETNDPYLYQHGSDDLTSGNSKCFQRCELDIPLHCRDDDRRRGNDHSNEKADYEEEPEHTHC